MTNFLKSFFYNKSRFYFNISFIYLLNKTVKYIIDRQVNYQDILTKKLQKYFTDPNMFFFNHGRGGFYFLLKHFKNKSKKKVLINSLTLFEMVNMIIYAGYDPVFVDNKKNSFETNTVVMETFLKKKVGRPTSEKQVRVTFLVKKGEENSLKK